MSALVAPPKDGAMQDLMTTWRTVSGVSTGRAMPLVLISASLTGACRFAAAAVLAGNLSREMETVGIVRGGKGSSVPSAVERRLSSSSPSVAAAVLAAGVNDAAVVPCSPIQSTVAAGGVAARAARS